MVAAVEVIPDAVVAAVVVVIAGGNAVRVGTPVGFVVLDFVVGLCEGIAVVGTSSGLAVGHAVSSGGVGACVTDLAVVGIPVVGFGPLAGEENGASDIFVVGLVVGVGSHHLAPRSSWHLYSEQHAHRVGYSLSLCRGKMARKASSAMLPYTHQVSSWPVSSSILAG
jgi:hypothetical protein